MKLKILYIICDPGFGGGSRHLFDLISSLDKNKFEPILISPISKVTEILKNKIKVYEMDIKNAWDLKAIKKIKEIAKQEKVNLAHLHSTRAGIIGTLAVKNLGIPIIYTEHLFTKDYIPVNKLIYIYQQTALKYLSRNITKVIAVSNAVKKILVDKKIFEKDKVEVIYNGISLRLVAYSLRSEFKNDQLTIGSIGALTEIKGYKYLVKAVQDIDNVKLEIIGEGKDLRMLKSIDKKNKVKFLGFQKDIVSYLNKWNIYVQPSLSESFGLTIAEAMTTGLPIIATNVGGISELVDNCGILISTKNEKLLANAIIELRDNSQLRTKLGQQGKERIKKYFLLELMIDKTEKLYERLAKKSA